MSRPDRWWRPSTTRRPPLRARQRQMYTEQEMGEVFDTAYTVGQGDERKRHRDREDMLLRLADASEAASNGDPGPMDELRREMGWRDDDLLDVADAAGATPLSRDVTADIPGHLVAEVEDWLRGQGGNG